MDARGLARRVGSLAALLSIGALVLGATPTGAAVVPRAVVPASMPDDAARAGVALGPPHAVSTAITGPVWGPAPAPAPSLPVAGPAEVANPRTGWGPSLDTVEAARLAVAGMSLEQLAGQVLVARYWESDPAAAGLLVGRWNLGGVILMGENIRTPEQVVATTAAVHGAVQAGGRTWPGIVAVDQEGGRVERLRGLVTSLPTLADLGVVGPDATRAGFEGLGRELRALGITMNMAPVADVTIGPEDPTIGDRSASTDPRVVSVIALAASRGLLDAGVVPVLKHFPGHGSVTTDSHVALPVQPASLAELESRDLLPFRAGIAAGLPVVMTGHLDMTQLDPGVPASLSPATYRLLRELGFEGVAVTDSLAMAAVPKPVPGQEAVTALVAGADLILMPSDVGAAHAAIVAAVRDGSLSAERLTEAAVRVVALQMWFAER